MSLLEFLTEDNLNVKCSSDVQFVNQHKIELKGKVRDLTSVEKSLKLILSKSQEKPLSLTAVAKRLGFNRRTLTRRFPELCQAISNQYIEYKKNCRLETIKKCIHEIEEAVVELNRQNIYPSESNVSKLISKPGYFREKEVRIALKKARQKLGIKK